jgi:hypothetical protein
LKNNPGWDGEATPEVRDAEPLEHGRALMTRLVQVVGTDRPLEGLAGLENLAERVDRVLAELRTVYEGTPQPMSGPQREALAVAQSLALEAARAYCIPAAALADAPSPERKLAPLILKAMQYLASTMHDSYAAYAKLPSGVWHKIHELYLLAERAVVATGSADRESRLSVAAVYGRALLLSLIDPYRLPEGQLDAVETLLAECGTALSLTRERPESAPGSHFIVECEEDRAPRPCRDDEATGSRHDVRFLDAGPLAEALRKRSAASALSTGADERATLAARLAGFLEDPPKRSLLREAVNGSVAICVGVKPIAHFVAHEAPAEAAAIEEASLRQGLTMPLRALPEDESGRLIPIHEWSVLNASRGGLRLRREEATEYPIAIGEVVGIRAPGNVQWRVGITRWITGLSEGATEFGIQFFANAVCAVWLWQAGLPGERKLGLLVAEGEHNSEEMLLAPPGTYLGAAEYELRGEGLRSRVRGTVLVEKNARFELFRIAAT